MRGRGLTVGRDGGGVYAVLDLPSSSLIAAEKQVEERSGVSQQPITDL